MLVFFFLYIVIDLFAHLDDILKQKVGIVLLLEYYVSYLPIIFVQVSPISCLLCTLYTYGRLNRENEIIAMRSSGLSVLQITKTVIIFGAVISMLVFWVNDRFVPQSILLTEQIRERMETGSKKAKPWASDIVNNLTMYGMKNRLFFVNKFYPYRDTMEGIIIFEHDEKQNVMKKIVANKGVYDRKGGLWRFYQCITYSFDKNGQMLHEPEYFDEEIMAIPESPEEFLKQRQRADLMKIAQLDEYAWKLSKSGANTAIRNLRVDIYQRFAAPLTSLIIIFLGIPFALRMKKRAAGFAAVGLCVMVGFLYYVLDAVCIAFGKAGVLPPVLSVFLSHIVAFITALLLINSLP
jgi:lipopolysaccharide export system permease protein